jgi:hypothetical protein
MPACRPFPWASAAAVPFRARAHPGIATSLGSGGLHCLLHGVSLFALITMAAAFGSAQQPAWSTALLSVERAGIAATSVQTSIGGNIAIFAGGQLTTGSLLHRVWGFGRGWWLRIHRVFERAAVLWIGLPYGRLLSHAHHFRWFF